MSGDAIAVFHPRDPDRLRPFLDLDDESEESDGLYAEELDDGTMLVHTFQPFEIFTQNPDEARAWLAQFGDALEDVHDDPRGLLFFPDDHEPSASTYDAVVAEMADKGIFVAIGLVDDEDEEDAVGLEALQALAGQLMGNAPMSAESSFEVAKMFEGVQQELLDALGMPHLKGGGPAGEKQASPVYDDEFGGEGEDEK
jgi:hypothetical protein